MKWFGASWGAPVCVEGAHVPVPDTTCSGCGIPFQEGDQGFTMPFSGGPGDPPELSWHHGCLMWNLGVTLVHVLVNGKALCGHVAVDAWPKKHTWRYLQGWREATCPGCRVAAYEMTRQVA